ncbi:MAG TPA: hypothetical protein ENK46_08325 [Flavobacteriia bacterium]|nr:hypothetical protein [Flavobacteriia bacterium]
MRKILLALSAVLVLASFTGNPDKTIILKDIDGTLLQSFPIIKKHNNEYTVTFTVDAMTVVTSNTDATGTHINLIENGSSNAKVSHTVIYKTKKLAFNNYFESNMDIASNDNMITQSAMLEKPMVIKE